MIHPIAKEWHGFILQGGERFASAAMPPISTPNLPDRQAAEAGILHKNGIGLIQMQTPARTLNSGKTTCVRAKTQLPMSTEQQSGSGVFQALFASANEEFSRLLRDVRRVQGQPYWRAEGWRRGELLMRALRCAAKQHILQAELRNLALKDELTGLHNHRGFYAFAERQLKVCSRSGQGMLLFFIDMDGLKQINDSLGHGEGDRALKRVAEALKETFRDSDIVGRLEGDEFAVLAVEASGHSEATIMARLQRRLRAANERDGGNCDISKCGSGPIRPQQTSVSPGIAGTSRPRGVCAEGVPEKFQRRG